MAVRLAQASHDERGAYSGGQAGNQTGTELNIRSWYNRPWDTILRARDAQLGAQIAEVAQVLVKCLLIGYDQILTQRVTLYDQCERIGGNLARIGEIQPCECDCSSFIAVVLRFRGIVIPKSINTSGMTAALQATGLFEVLRDPKYLTGGDYLRKGDIVLNTWHHVAVCLDNGSKAVVITFTPYQGTVVVQTHLKVRIGPGSQYPEFMVDGGDGTWTPWRLPPNTRIQIVEENGDWGRVGNTIGWVSLRYLIKI